MTFETCASTSVKEQRIWRKLCLCLWSGLIDSCLSHSAKGLNGKCKHHYHFQQTAITSLFFGNVDQSSCQAKTRQAIFSTFLTDCSHATLKCPGSCCWFSLHCFKFSLTQVKNRKCVCTTITDVHWSRTVLSNDLKWWQLMNVMWQQLRFWDVDLYYFTNSHICHITRG